MASDLPKKGRKRLQSEFKIRLVPQFDPDSEINNRKAVAQKIMAMMFDGLRKRGRPKKEEKDLDNVA